MYTRMVDKVIDRKFEFNRRNYIVCLIIFVIAGVVIDGGNGLLKGLLRVLLLAYDITITLVFVATTKILMRNKG